MKYPTYSLEVYSNTQGKWIASTSHAASNKPHHYAVLRKAFDRLVNGMQDCTPRTVIGYRILQDGSVIDTWRTK